MNFIKDIYLISASHDSTIILWDFLNKSVIYTLNYHTRSVECLALSQDAKYLVSGSRDRQIIIWKMELKAITTDLGNALYRKVVFSKNIYLFVTENVDNSLCVWDLEN